MNPETAREGQKFLPGAIAAGVLLVAGILARGCELADVEPEATPTTALPTHEQIVPESPDSLSVAPQPVEPSLPAVSMPEEIELPAEPRVLVPAISLDAAIVPDPGRHDSERGGFVVAPYLRDHDGALLLDERGRPIGDRENVGLFTEWGQPGFDVADPRSNYYLPMLLTCHTSYDSNSVCNGFTAENIAPGDTIRVTTPEAATAYVVDDTEIVVKESLAAGRIMQELQAGTRVEHCGRIVMIACDQLSNDGGRAERNFVVRATAENAAIVCG